MLTEKDFLEKGYKSVADNLYEKDGNLYVQQRGEIKFASSLNEEELDSVTDLGAYRAYQKLAKKDEGTKNPKKKEEKKQPEEKKRVNEAVIVRDENEAHDFMNIKDDQQVLEEMQGKYLEEFIYSFPIKEGKTVTGLSWAGVKEVARTAGNIEVEDLKIAETDKSFRVQAKARDTKRNVAMFGIAEQSKTMKLKNGDIIEDGHALSKCVSRAQRNAIRVLIPELTIKTMIEQYLKEKVKK
jgi:hypothetical protein